ncbi:MAG: aminofutalosine synthase MqnE [Oligoflexales bacterium]
MAKMNQIREKILSGTRIDTADALYLYESADLLSVGALANYVNVQKNQGKVFYNINRHINPTNICVMSCKFCAFARKPGDEGAYAYSIAEILEKAEEAVAQGATEIHMVGGLHPRWKLDYYLEILSTVKERFPSLHIKGFTAVEIDWLARKARMPVQGILSLMKRAGLGSMPGGGAEVFHEDVRHEITAKLSTEDWLDIHRTAHKMGLMSNCTMLYGHVESYEHRIYHLEKLRELQDETHGFNAFIPLSFQPHNNEMGIKRYTFGFDDLKNLAISRLFLDNFNHIKSYWIMMGQDIAQLGLFFGANDLDGTVVQEKISRMAGGRAGMLMSQNNLENLILKTGHIPVERDTLYKPLRETCQVNEPLAPVLSASNLAKSSRRSTFSSEPKQSELLELAKEQDFFKLGKLAAEMSLKASNTEVSFAPSLEIKVREIAQPFKLQESLDSLLDKNLSENKLSPSAINLDLSGIQKQSAGERVNFSGMLENIQVLKKRFPACSLSVSGTRGLWYLVQTAQKSLGEGFKYLKENQVNCFQSSIYESERGITKTEVTNLHHAAHDYELPTIPKVEINVAPRADSPMWDNFFYQLISYREVQKESGGIIGLSIEPAKDSFITPAEFIMAVSLARIAIPNIPRIICNLLRIPTLSPAKGEGSSAHLAEEKLSPIVISFGANDLGQIPINQVVPEAVFEEILAAGFKPKIRNADFSEMVSTSWLETKGSIMRHKPKLHKLG